MEIIEKNMKIKIEIIEMRENEMNIPSLAQI